MTGDSEDAIEDFAFYVEWLKRTGQYEAGGIGWEAWIAELEAGRDPFDAATLEGPANDDGLRQTSGCYPTRQRLERL